MLEGIGKLNLLHERGEKREVIQQIKDNRIGCSQTIIDLDDRVPGVLNLDITTLNGARGCDINLTLERAKKLRDKLNEWISLQ